MHKRKTFEEYNMAEEVKEGQSVLLIWSGSTPPKKIEEIVARLNSSVGSTGKVSVEHEERLKLCEYETLLLLLVKRNDVKLWYD